jgi:heme exporter protein B
LSALAALFGRELSLAWGRGGGPLLACAFYLCTATLLPLAVGPEPERLAAVAPGAAWLTLGLASLLSLERLWERDYEDGALDLLALGPAPLELTAAAKCGAQWLAAGLPLALLTPVVSTVLGAEARLAPLALAAALLGGLAFAFVGGVGAALATGSRRGGVLIAVIVLPLYAPPVIFGAGALQAAADGLPWGAGLALLGAYALFAAALGPFAMAAAVRNAIS